MTQQHLMFDDLVLPEVDEDGYQVDFAATSSSNSGRTMRGVMKNSVLFTVEAYNLKWTDISASIVSQILKKIIGKNEFDFYHYNVYKGIWETGRFYVANISSPFYRLNEGEEKVGELSFQVTGVNPL